MNKHIILLVSSGFLLLVIAALILWLFRKRRAVPADSLPVTILIMIGRYTILFAAIYSWWAPLSPLITVGALVMLGVTMAAERKLWEAAAS